MNEPPIRRPKAVRLDAADADIVLVPERIEPEEASPAISQPRRGRWGTVFFTALGGLITLALGLWVSQLVEELFARTEVLGWLGVALLILLLVAVMVILGRELAALRRLGRVDRLREAAVLAIASDDRTGARALAVELAGLYAARPDMAGARAELQGHLAEIVDGADLVRLTERALMTDLDRRALRMVLERAKRVSLFTAISPRALFDVLMVTTECARLIRALADLYGARPGSLGFWRLGRAVLGHLAITGGMAAGESLVQQLVGHGLAARLSAKLGEGVVNGLMTARVGLSTIDLVRPLPFVALERPRLGAVLGELTG
jgi:putative membrane protein